MKKRNLLFVMPIILLVFIIGCVEEVSEEELTQELDNLTEEELNYVLSDDEEALAGQASKFGSDRFKRLKYLRRNIKPYRITCSDSDGGDNPVEQGTTRGPEELDGIINNYNDYCLSYSTVQEYWCNEFDEVRTSARYCSEEWWCREGFCAFRFPPDDPYPLLNEVEISPVKFVSGNIRVFVSEGYEPYGEKMLQDIEYCFDLVPGFVGIDSYWQGLDVKIYVTSDDSNSGSYSPSFGTIYYARSQENIGFDLRDVLENSPEGFLFQSLPYYCANTHEFTHFLVTRTPIPSWANEGIAEYSQKFNQPGSKEDTKCNIDGFYSGDPWETGEERRFFSFSDLSEEFGSELGAGPKWYRSAMCFWELFDSDFGDDMRRKVFQTMRADYTIIRFPGDRGYEFESGEITEKEGTEFFVEEILLPIIGSENTDRLIILLTKFGFEEGIDYNVN